MKKVRSTLMLLLATTGMLAVVGCNGQSAPMKGDKHAHDHHDHSSEGPHHGQLIELGKEEYHAELLHDDTTHTITIYLLDSKAKSATPIEATQLALNLIVDGKPQQYSLAAKPLPTDPTGQCSCFSTTEAAVCEALDDEKTTGRLTVDIGDKHFVGTIEHHDHGHDHK